MKIMYLPGSQGKTQLYLDARVGIVIPATLLVTDKCIPVPALVLEYDLRSLGPVSAILGSMHKRQEHPVVHIWDIGKPDPEVAVFFRTMSPEKPLLDTITGKVGESINTAFATVGFEQVYTVAEVNLGQRDVRRLIREFRDCGRILAIEVRELNISRDEAPVKRFVTRQIIRRRPDPLMKL